MTALRVLGAERRRDDLLEEPCFSLGARAKAPEVPRGDAEAGQVDAGGHDLDVPLGKEFAALVGTRLYEPVFLQLVDEGGVGAGRSQRAARPISASGARSAGS